VSAKRKPWGWFTRYRGRKEQEPLCVTANVWRSVKLVHPDGRPVEAGDLKAGQAYSFDAETGVVVPCGKTKRVRIAPNPSRSSSKETAKR
jgi:hypothetical protein